MQTSLLHYFSTYYLKEAYCLFLVKQVKWTTITEIMHAV